MEGLIGANSRLKTELDEALREASKLREELRAAERKGRGGSVGSTKASTSAKAQSRYWTQAEHERFLTALSIHGAKDVRAIADHVGTRNPTQVRTHAQKYFLRLAREKRRGDQGTTSSGSGTDNNTGHSSGSGIDLLLSVADSGNKSLAPVC
eukprot:Plantae.Rhodophyta-Purpureofilum_apyrenoidigerum.ctg56037.p1 GENE.Plantae.Rhodophyta-Purpureofilum_apyrenoidigerum.ctg56037~~Plantae.Rhodophyta-Purpureofilum_apyrenoidigerum.ctg56037.p1  ORF type:complete len:163 (+),score=26.52 Plantae.Rhodophyta-Purpureofilum_apyrenoidigerum.ctg56037:36-491(+)